MVARARKFLSAIPFTTLYYAQGLPFSIVRQMSVVYFQAQGVSLKSLGFTGLYGIPWTFKFLWSPLVDVFSTKRRWIVIMEMILTVVIGLVAAVVSKNASVSFVAAMFLAVAFVSATHDIAVDGFYLEALNRDEQARYSGWIVAAYRLAMLTGTGFFLSLVRKLNWDGILGVAALFFAALTVWHWFILPHPQRDQNSTNGQSQAKPQHDTRQLVEGFKAFLQLKGIALAVTFIILFKVGDALLFGMSTPFINGTLINLYGGDKLRAAEVFGKISVLGMIAAMTGPIVGGWFISRYRLRRGLWIFGIVQNVSIPVYAFVASLPHISEVHLAVALIVEQLAAGLGTAAYSNFVMRQVDPRFKATHYAIASGLMALTTMIGSVISGFGAQKYGFPLFFVLAFAASVPGLFLIPFVARRPECQ